MRQILHFLLSYSISSTFYTAHCSFTRWVLVLNKPGFGACEVVWSFFSFDLRFFMSWIVYTAVGAAQKQKYRRQSKRSKSLVWVKKFCFPFGPNWSQCEWLSLKLKIDMRSMSQSNTTKTIFPDYYGRAIKNTPKKYKHVKTILKSKM